MAELEIEGSFEEQWGAMKSAVKQQHVAIYGNGHEGILDFVAGVRGQFRLLVVLITLLGVLVAAVGVMVTIHMNQHGELHWPSMAAQNPPTERAQSAPQNSDIYRPNW